MIIKIHISKYLNLHKNTINQLIPFIQFLGFEGCNMHLVVGRSLNQYLRFVVNTEIHLLVGTK